MTKSTTFVDITNTEQITGTSKGHVGVTWQAGDGASRQQQIEEARRVAHAEYQKQLKEGDPYVQRLLQLEKAVEKLQAQVKLLQNSQKG